MLLIEYDWDCLEAEYFEQTRLVGKVVTTLYVLQLVAKESPTSDKLIGGFTLASPLMVGRTTAMDLWEHIRRFMEENGPALSSGDEPSPPYPTSFIKAAFTLHAACITMPRTGSASSSERSKAECDFDLLIGDALERTQDAGEAWCAGLCVPID